MARIAINVSQHPDPTLVEEDVEIAAKEAGIRDFHVIDQGGDCFTLDAYSDEEIPLDQFAAFQTHLPKEGSYTVEHLPGWPPKGWAYADRPINYA